LNFRLVKRQARGNLVQALKDFLKGEDIEGRSYRFGLNLADIWKRSFTQILNKGIVLENWGHKIYWVVQEPVYRDFMNRYNLDYMTYDDEHTTVFLICDLKEKAEKYVLFQTKIESSTISDLFKAFRNNPNIPSKDTFINKLQIKLKAKMALKLELG